MRFLLLVMIAACGAPRLSGGIVLPTGSTTSTPPPLLSGIRVRFVHMYALGNGTPGEPVDIRRKWSTTTSLGEESTPVVSALAYGQVSELVSPFDDSDAFAFYSVGSTSRTGPYAGFLLSERFRDGDVVTVHIVSAKNGTSSTFIPAWNVRQEFPINGFPPAANATQARVVVNDIGISEYQNNGFFVGAGGACFTDIDSTSPSLLVTGHSVFDFAPGAISLSLYANPTDGPGGCAGSAAIGPANFTASANTRTWVYLYGPSPTDLRTLVLPFAQ